jgi:hypothetical protein
MGTCIWYDVNYLYLISTKNLDFLCGNSLHCTCTLNTIHRLAREGWGQNDLNNKCLLHEDFGLRLAKCGAWHSTQNQNTPLALQGASWTHFILLVFSMLHFTGCNIHAYLGYYAKIVLLVLYHRANPWDIISAIIPKHDIASHCTVSQKKCNNCGFLYPNIRDRWLMEIRQDGYASQQ